MIQVQAIVHKSIRDVLKRAKASCLSFPLKLDGDDAHLEATIEWLVRATKHGNGGVSSHYSLLSGRWLEPFPETTGYIIPTFFDYAEHSKDSTYADLAIQLTDWLGEVQLPDGGCVQGVYNGNGNRPVIFNTGQNIFGFLRTYQETQEKKHLARARRAGDFLLTCVDHAGIWNRSLHHGIPHTYNSRTSWALLELFQITGIPTYKEVAVSNLNWIVHQQEDNGWFCHANFKPGELPNTHGLAYTVRGLLESHLLTQDPQYLATAKETADRLLRLFESRKFIYTFWDRSWKNHGKYLPQMKGRYSCVTGNVQLAIVWMRLFQITGDTTYLDSAFKMVDFVKLLQDTSSKNPGVKGAIPGAFPIFGSYSFLKYPNWAAKFFADALMLKMRLLERS